MNTGGGMNRRRVGTWYEEKAAELLEEKGYVILARNFRCRLGEIDLVARDYSKEKQTPTLVFAEVKYRTHAGSGYPEEAVDFRKQRTICRTADFFRVRYRICENVPIRFDVIAIDGYGIRHYEDAFSYQ